MCLVGPRPLGSKMEVMTHMVNFLFKNTLFYLRCLYDTQVFRKYNISEEKNSQMFSYMLIFLVCVWLDFWFQKLMEMWKLYRMPLKNGNQIWRSGPIVNLYILHVQIILPILLAIKSFP